MNRIQKATKILNPILVYLIFTSGVLGCVPNLYRVDTTIRGLNLDDNPATRDSSGMGRDSAGMGWYYSLTGKKPGRAIVAFQKFGQGYPWHEKGSVEPEKRYAIPETVLTEGYNVTFKQGWSLGTLVVPFKFRPDRFGAASGLFGSSALGPYLGYRVNIGDGLDMTPIAFGGLTVVALTDTNSKSSDNLIGLSYGGGMVFHIGKNFQLGLVLGGDFIGGELGANWLYRNALWLSFGIGYKFLNFDTASPSP